MTGHSILTNKPYQEEEIRRELDSVATEAISDADTALEKKGEKNEISEPEIEIIQHITMNDTTQMVRLCMSLHKIDLTQKGHDLTDCQKPGLK